MSAARKRHDSPVGPKGPPGTPDCETLKREWTNLDVDAERAQLEELLKQAKACGDQPEVERISARLRLLQ